MGVSCDTRGRTCVVFCVWIESCWNSACGLVRSQHLTISKSSSWPAVHVISPLPSVPLLEIVILSFACQSNVSPDWWINPFISKTFTYCPPDRAIEPSGKLHAAAGGGHVTSLFFFFLLSDGWEEVSVERWVNKLALTWERMLWFQQSATVHAEPPPNENFSQVCAQNPFFKKMSLMIFENTETNTEACKTMKKQVNFSIPVSPWLLYTIKTQSKRTGLPYRTADWL